MSAFYQNHSKNKDTCNSIFTFQHTIFNKYWTSNWFTRFDIVQFYWPVKFAYLITFI